MDEKELYAAINNCLAMVTATRYGQGREAKEWALAAAVLIDKANGVRRPDGQQVVESA